MKAAILYAENVFKYEDTDIGACLDDEVKIKVKAAGICGSDIHKMAGKWKYSLPAIMGHEFAGFVVEKGKNVTNLEIGERVVAIPFLPCNKCENCKQGNYSLCDDYEMIGSDLHGGFAEYVNIKASNVLSIGDMDLDEASMIEPSAVALHGVMSIKPQIGDTAAIFGVGTIGLLTMQWLRIAGVKVIIAIDISDEKLDAAKAIGCEKVINPLKDNLIEKIDEYTNSSGVDIAVECAGSKITQEQCLLVTRKRGKVGYLGIAYSDIKLSERAFENIFRRELTLKGSWNSYSAPFPGREWINSIDFIKSGRIKVKPLISHRYSLEDTQNAFDMIRQRKEPYGKVLIIPNGE